MVMNQAIKQTSALAVTVGLSLQLVLPVLAADDFGADWQAKPLIDNTAKPQALPSQPAAKPVTQAAQPKPDAELEAKLKPAEPFISSVEKQLAIKPKAGDSLVNRLDTLQNVLYGESKYQDAGELLAQLASVFPNEAAKAHADLTAKMQSTQQQAAAQPGNPPAGKTSKQKQVIDQPQQTAASYPQSGYNNYQSQPQPQPQKKKKLWDNDDDPFKNDPFFQDQPATYQSQQPQQSGPSKIGAIGQGLAGLAMMAGAVAGSYYMNKNSNGLYPNNGYYNNPGYGYGNYGNPYGYGYGNNYTPYGYGTAYGTPYGYASPFGRTSITTQPYRQYGTTNSTISPLGVPTGFYPY